MNRPLVSIIMPAYNAGKYISEAIDSVIRQTLINWELIIINDGSTDNTKEIVASYALSNMRIKLINQENKRLGAARNEGIKNANGEWLAFLDADDLWVDIKLEKQLSTAEQHPGAGVIFTNGFTFYQDDLKTAKPYGSVAGYYSPTAMYKLEYSGNYIPVLSVIVKKKHIDSIGQQDENPYVYGCEDWDYWLRLALQGVSFYGMEEKLFYYRKHASNMSNDNSLMSLANAAIFIKNFKRELLSAEDISRITGFVNRTICGFIKPGKINEALFLNNGMYNISGHGLRKFSSFVMDKLGKRSYYLIRLVFKIDSMLNYR